MAHTYASLRALVLTAAAAVGLACGAQVNLSSNVTAFYEKQSYSVANYYMILSDNSSATYNSSTGLVSMKGAGYMMALDLYAAPCETKPLTIPAGTYTANDNFQKFTYNADREITYLMKFNKNGDAVESYPLTSSIELTLEGTKYSITTEADINGTKTPVTFSGTIAFEDTEEKPYVWPQLKKDIDVTFTHAQAVYDGNLWDSNTGEFYLNLSTVSLNEENGAMTEPNGTRFAIMLFDKLFSDPKDAYVMPTTYTVGRSFKRGTYYPGIEMDYMGMTFPMGFYVQEYAPGISSDSNMGYSYVTDGTVDIKRDDEGVYDITVDCVSSYGHTIRGTYHGTIPVHDQSTTSSGSHISTLETDVNCDLEQIPVARLQYAGLEKNNCHALVLDIGSPSGKDKPLVDNGGDIIRFEMLQSAAQPYLLEGTYTVAEERWETYFAPYILKQGYFRNGDLTGTRYMHFIEGRYMVMDHLAPVVSGTLGVTKNNDDTWTFKFSFMDDANFYINGEWTGPVEYTFDPQAIIAGTVSAEIGSSEINFVRIDADHLRIDNLPAGATVSVIAINGMQCPASVDADGIVDLSGLGSGIYVVRAADKSFKINK